MLAPLALADPSLRPPRPPRPPSPPRPGGRSAEVISTIDEAPDAVTVRLRLAHTAGFLPGQYYNVRLAVLGRPRPVQRAYSVGSSPVPDPWLIDPGVREVPGGLVSPRLVQDMPVGQLLEVRGPTGRFTWVGDDGQPVLLVGAGSGLVPLMAMIRYAAMTGLDVPMSLVCSAATYDHALYRGELAQLVAQHRWLRVVHCVTRDRREPRVDFHRRIDRDMLAEVLDGVIPAHAYLCGPPAMVEGVAAALADIGLGPSSIRSEKYD